MWRNAGITLNTSPIERYAFSDSKLYYNFFSNSENKNMFSVENIFQKKSEHFPKFWKNQKIMMGNSKSFAFQNAKDFEFPIIIFWFFQNFGKCSDFFSKNIFDRKNIFVFGVGKKVVVQFRIRKSISFDWRCIQSDSGIPSHSLEQFCWVN